MTIQINNELTFTTIVKSSAQLTKISSSSIGLVSMDDLIMDTIGIHPRAIAEIERLSVDTQAGINEKIQAKNGSDDIAAAEFFVSELASVLVKAAKKQGEKPLKVRLSGADSFVRSGLLGSELEGKEVNPLMGLRGVSLYSKQEYRKSFELECEVIKRVLSSQEAGNIELVVPFVRTFSEAATVIDLLAEQGLCRGFGGLKIHMVCGLPINALLAETFLQYFDGLVIDIEQIAQFTLGLDIENKSINCNLDTQTDALFSQVLLVLKAAKAVHKPCDIYCRFIAKSPRLQSRLHEYEIESVIC